jgi:hypothetical protein
MGRVTYELAQKFGLERPWNMLLVSKSFNNFENLKNRLASLLYQKDKESGLIILSPGDTRFDLFFLTAENAELGAKLMKDLSELLPDGKFTVKL